MRFKKNLKRSEIKTGLKTMEKIKELCPHCQSELKDVGIQFVERAIITYDVNLDSQGELSWEIKDIDNDWGDEEKIFICGNCSEKLNFSVDRKDEIKQVLGGR